MANSMNIDKEWENFISSAYSDDISDEEDTNNYNTEFDYNHIYA